MAAIAVSTAVFAGQSNSLMDISVDGRFLACTNRDSGSVTVVELTSKPTPQKLFEVPLGKQPEGVTFLGTSHALATAVYADDKVVFVDAATGKRTGEVQVNDEPYGVVSNQDGSRIYVTLEYPGQVVEIDTTVLKVTRTFAAGHYPRGIAFDAARRRLLITEYYTAAVRALDITTGRENDHWPAASTDNLLRQLSIHPTRGKAYLPHIRSRVAAAHGQGSIFPYVSVLDTPRGEGKRRKRIPMDAFQGNLVVANPWEVAVSPDGRQLYVVFGGTDDMFACDVVDDDYTEISLRRRVSLGRNPRAVRVSPDGATVYVYGALDFSVSAYDTKTLRETSTIAVTENPLKAEVRTGKILFYSATQPMSGRRWISCSSCHPDGQSDGRTWSNPEGQRNTPALFGLAWTHPLHWSADRDETQDFEHTIRGPLMQGRGLVRGELNESLSAANKGLSQDLDALAAYTNSHTFTLSPHAKGGLSPAAKRGRDVFFSAETGCVACHGGPFYTDSRPGAKIVRHNVGTGDDDPSEKMGPEYDTPTLLGVYRTAPYLHHGRAKDLTEVLRKHNPRDQHGKTRHLTDGQVADLVEFLKSLPYEAPGPLAEKAGLKKIER